MIFDSSRLKKPTLHLVLVLLLLLQQLQQGLHGTSAQAQKASVQLRNVQGQVQKELLSGQLQGGSNKNPWEFQNPKLRKPIVQSRFWVHIPLKIMALYMVGTCNLGPISMATEKMVA